MLWHTPSEEGPVILTSWYLHPHRSIQAALVTQEDIAETMELVTWAKEEWLSG